MNLLSRLAVVCAIPMALVRKPSPARLPLPIRTRERAGLSCRIVVPVFLGLVATADVSSAVSVTNLQLTSNSVSFDINSSFSLLVPNVDRNVLYFVNPTTSASPGFALGSFMVSDSASFTGVQSLRSYAPISTGGDMYGDYFYVAFENPFASFDWINGTVTANWGGNTAFDPSSVSILDVYWGSIDSYSVNTGEFLGAVSVNEGGGGSVPEIDPAGLGSVLALVTGALGLLERRRAATA